MKSIIIFTIRLYQRTISPDHGWLQYKYPYGFCKFHPSCSEYTAQSILEHGTIKGIALGSKRIIRCNPFTTPKVDLVPKKN